MSTRAPWPSARTISNLVAAPAFRKSTCVESGDHSSTSSPAAPTRIGAVPSARATKTPQLAPLLFASRAIERGEIAADTDLDVTLDLLYGPIYHRLLHGHAPLTDRFVQDVVDAVLKAISPGR